MDLPQRHREHGVRRFGKIMDGSEVLYALVANSRSFWATHSESAESLFMLEKG